MKTQEECMRAVVDGKVLINGSSNVRIRFKDGRLVDQNGAPRSCYFDLPENWSIHTPATYTKLEDAIAAMRAGRVVKSGGYKYRIHDGQLETLCAVEWKQSHMSLSNAFCCTFTEVDDA